MQSDLRQLTIGAIPVWATGSVEDFQATVVSGLAPFPCTFAVSAARKGALRFAFVEDIDEEATWLPMVSALEEYLREYQAISRDTSFVVFFRPDIGDARRTMDEWFARFWRILQFLHERDPSPWPAGMPVDPDDPMWEFSFAGTPMFVVCNTPAHRRRRSRCSPGFLVTFQPRWVFEGLEAHSPRGAAARQVIRRRLRAFDEAPAAPALGAYGDAANREWRQYFLADDDLGEYAKCPFDAIPEPTTAARKEDRLVYRVAVNADEQYALWPALRSLAVGWRDAGMIGTKEECLAFVAVRWTDLTPLRVRKRLAA